MSRLEFMKQLARLLDDLPREEKIEILKYYNGYFDDAGVENEAAIIQKLGSPEKVAAEVKAGIQDELAGEENISAESAAQESRTENAHSDTSESGAQKENTGAYGQFTSQSAENHADASGPCRERNIWRTVAIVAILMATFPVWIGLLGGLIGLLGGVIGIAVALVAGLIGSLIGLVAGAFGCLAGGIAILLTSPVSGMLSVAVGIFLLGLVLLLGLVIWLLFAKLVPGVIGGITKLIRWVGKSMGGIINEITGRGYRA